MTVREEPFGQLRRSIPTGLYEELRSEAADPQIAGKHLDAPLPFFVDLALATTSLRAVLPSVLFQRLGLLGTLGKLHQ
jgi:hypothetical protein